MGRELLWLIGVPGVGKSSAWREATRDKVMKVNDKPIAHRLFPGGVELGSYAEKRGGFTGSDGLSMSVQPQALAFMAGIKEGVVCGEGDRLGNESFLIAAAGLRFNVHLVALLADPSTSAQRRAMRGSKQNDTWLRGRTSKVSGLLQYVAPEWRIQTGGMTIDEVASRLREHPVMQRLLS